MFNRLTRAHLSFLVAFSALAGYLFHPTEPNSMSACLLFAGVWLLSAGASALNQAQEKDIDARMTRTRNRPLVTGRLSLRSGLILALLLIGGGLLALLATDKQHVVYLGLFSLFWYNGVYTHLKKVTPFAVLPGALCGALPPIMGWVLAGGAITDYPIMMLAAIIVLWQVPHFWLLALAYPEDVRRSGLPDLFSRVRPEQLRRLSCIWILALLAGIACANLSGLLQADLSRMGVAIAMLLMSGALFRYHRSNPEPVASIRLFVQLNMFMTLWLVAIAVDRFTLTTFLMTSLG